MKQLFLVLLYLSPFFFLPFLQAQEANKLVVKPVLAMQLWSTYTTDYQVFNTATQRYEPVDDRLNFTLHRSRIGLKGSYDTRLVYDFTGSLDFVGQGALTGTVGGLNNGASPRFRIWNALVQYKVSPQSEDLYLTFGYMCPQLSRESVTSPFTVSSFEKAWSQNYIRRHVTGLGPGRIVGLNLGGFNQVQPKLALNYDVGIYNPVNNAYGGNSTGSQYSPLLTYRLGIHLGDAESSKYSRGHKFNYKGLRNGITLAVSGSHQGNSDLWDKNTSFGVDILANFKQFNLAGEWMQLDRSLGTVSTTATSGFIKLGYYTENNNKGIEPVITYCFLSAPTEEREQLDAQSLNAFSGEDNYWEFTLNYYLSSKTRLSLSYTLRDGEAGAVDPSTVLNNYFQQGGVGAVQRGNYLGIGFLFTI